MYFLLLSLLIIAWRMWIWIESAWIIVFWILLILKMDQIEKVSHYAMTIRFMLAEKPHSPDSFQAFGNHSILNKVKQTCVHLLTQSNHLVGQSFEFIRKLITIRSAHRTADSRDTLANDQSCWLSIPRSFYLYANREAYVHVLNSVCNVVKWLMTYCCRCSSTKNSNFLHS